MQQFTLSGKQISILAPHKETMLDVLDEGVLSHGMIPSVFVSPQVLKVTLHFWSVNGNGQYQSRAIDLKEKQDYCINT